MWGGDVSKFPSFVVSLMVCTREGKWDYTANKGILTVARNNILTDYHSVTEKKIQDARIACTNHRSIQNSKAMYNCVKSSIGGDIKDTIFT